MKTTFTTPWTKLNGHWVSLEKQLYDGPSRKRSVWCSTI